MKVRKVLALALCAALVLGCVVSAGAESEPADAALMAVTAKVKDALGLDTNVFTQFSGSLDEDNLGGKRWNLDWSGDGVSLSIIAGENGKIYYYTRSESTGETSAYYGNGLTIPSLPEDKTQAAYNAAVAFVNKAVNLDGESAVLENDVTPSLTATTYRFRGEIQVSGLSTPIGCSVTVRASDLTITRFRRDDAYSQYVGAPNSAKTSVTESGARRQLRSTLTLEPQYVLDDNGTTAHVMYVPVAGDDYYVDGATGELVNLTQLQNAMWLKNSDLFYGMTEDSTAAGESGSSLSKAELEGAAKLAGAMDQDALDRILKNAWPEIGLTNYTIRNFSYRLGKTDSETGETPVTASLTYARQLGEDMVYKYVTMDAKTGALESLYTYRGSTKNSESTVKYSYNVALTAAQSTAETVLSAFAGKNYAALGLASTTEGRANNTWEHVFRFEQEQDGYFYHDNCYVVGIDTADGTLTQLSGAFDETVELISPAHSIVTPQTAQNAYEGALTAKYGYLEVPVDVTHGEYYSAALKDLGYEYLTALRAGWVLTATEGKNPRMVDALTGEVVYYPADDFSDEGISYSDLEGHWVKTAAEALGRYGVGLYTESLNPSASLTQLDMIALLCSVDGYRFDLSEAATDPDTQNELYDAGYRLGLVTPATRDPQRVLTRGELVKLLLDSAGYEKIASLSQIYTATFADWSTLSDAERGYAALAQGLGLVNGGSGNLYASTRAATRAEAIAMLYQYMSK